MTAGKRGIAAATLLAGVCLLAAGQREMATVAGVLLFASLISVR